MEALKIKESDYSPLIFEGEQSLIKRFGNCFPDTTPFPEEPLKKEFRTMKKNNNELIEIPVAPKDYVLNIEQKIYAICAPYSEHIHEMTAAEIEAYLWVHLMAYDIQRGLGFAQIPHLLFDHSEEFQAWEKWQFDWIELREKELGLY